MSEQTKKPIEKPWVIINWQSYHEIERIIKEESDQLYLKHLEEQDFDEIWSSKPVKKFKTAKETINYFSREYSLSVSKVRQDLFDRFPKTMKHEYLQAFHDLLFVYGYKNAQTLPKCTSSTPPLEELMQWSQDIVRQMTDFSHSFPSFFP